MDKEIIKAISDKFDIPEWDSEEGKEKRRKVAKALNNAMTNIGKALSSSLNNREKAKIVRNYLKNLGWGSGLWGLWEFISKTDLNAPKVNMSLRDFSIDFSNVIELGPTFWLKVAAFLFILRIVHKIVSSGAILVKDASKIWNGIKNIFKENVANEGFMSIEEYRNLKLLID